MPAPAVYARRVEAAAERARLVLRELATAYGALTDSGPPPTIAPIQDRVVRLGNELDQLLEAYEAEYERVCEALGIDPIARG